MLTEKQTYRVTTTDNNIVEVLTTTTIFRDGVAISSGAHGHTISPGQSYAGEVKKVRRLTKQAHVPTAVAAYKAEQAYAEAKYQLDMEDTADNRKKAKRLLKKRDQKQQEYEEYEKGGDDEDT